MSRILAANAPLTGSRRPTDPDYVTRQYIRHPDRIECSLAIDAEGAVLGFQSLKRASDGNPYDLPQGWGIIGTHISPLAARRGVGAALFAVSRGAAVKAGLSFIDATIANSNAGALAYYQAMGFETWREMESATGKRFRVS